MTSALSGRQRGRATARGAPLILRVSRAIERRGWRGGTALLRLARRVGALDRDARYALGHDVSVDVPLSRRPMDGEDVARYESVFVDRLSAAIDAMGAPVTFIDCGADFGLISLKLVAQCRQVVQVIALEPNSVSHATLALNLSRLPCPARAELAAAGERCGRGELRFPGHDPDSEVSCFVVPNVAGAFPVVTIDSLAHDVHGCVALKCDVEGSELAVVRGALDTLRRAPRFVVAFEAHPDHVARTGIEPMEIVAELRRIRACRTMIAETGRTITDVETALFTQLGERRIANVICCSIDEDGRHEQPR